jgi:hypothetical protein
MPTLDITDHEQANLAELLGLLDGDQAAPFLAVIGGSWITSLREKVGGPVARPAMTNAEMKEALGRFAADAGTREEVDTLRKMLADAEAVTVDARAAMVELGVEMDNAKPLSRDSFTKLAREHMARPKP